MTVYLFACAVACSTYPCLFVSCEQHSVEHSLSSLCLCQRRAPTTNEDIGDCVVRVIPLRQSQQQQQTGVSCSGCMKEETVCDCDSAVDRRQRRAAACRRGQCGSGGRAQRAVSRREVSPAGGGCRNGGTPTGPTAGPSALCRCRAGFFGDRCQLVDPCGQQPCRNGGYCRSLVDLTGLAPPFP